MTATAIIQRLPINSILAPSHVRISNGHDKESLTNLADSIKEHGLMQPIIVRHSEEGEAAPFTIVVGRRRLAACKLAGMSDVPSIVSDTDEAKAYELEIAENIQREQMTLADTARAVRTLMLIHDNNPKKVGSIVNKSPAWVSKHLTITANTFAPPVAELLDCNIVGDLETLLLLNQIAKVAAAHPDASSTLTRMLRIAHAGDMNRQIARDALAKLKAPKAPVTPELTTTTTTKGSTQTSLDLQPQEPQSVFHLTLPIELLEEYTARCEQGGNDWLATMLRNGDGPFGQHRD